MCKCITYCLLGKNFTCYFLVFLKLCMNAHWLLDNINYFILISLILFLYQKSYEQHLAMAASM